MPKDLLEIENILRSGALSFGEYGKGFEEKLKSFIGGENVLTINTHSMTLLVLLATLGVKPLDEIIASPMSCLASNLPLITTGAKIRWADIDPKTGTLCPDSVKSQISSRTKLIIHNHYCGYPGYIDEINAIGREYGVTVVDDGIEAFGAEYKGKRIGNVGTDVTTFSFQTIRLPNTIDGGGLVFREQSLYKKSLLARDYGIERKCFRNDFGEINSECDVSIPGYGAMMSEVNSYIGERQMNQIEELISMQRRNARYWSEKILQICPDSYNLNKREEILPNYWVFGFLTNDKVKTILKFREMGYYASGVHLNNNNYSVFGESSELPGVYEFNKRFVAIPCGWWLKEGKECV
ncbi:aminotransferase DegT [Paenibacillus sp. 598K]|nr:aminotransferase DegT [Paenibacillus sp. 598K]